MATYVYGIVTASGEHIDVARTLTGAKRYATKEGYSIVSKRDVNHYYVKEVAFKDGNKWRELEPTAREIIDSNVQRARENIAKIYG